MDNKQAIGYMLCACEALGVKDKDFIRKLQKEMSYQFDVKTEDEAEKKGFAWYYSLEG